MYLLYNTKYEPPPFMSLLSYFDFSKPSVKLLTQLKRAFYSCESYTNLTSNGATKRVPCMLCKTLTLKRISSHRKHAKVDTGALCSSVESSKWHHHKREGLRKNKKGKNINESGGDGSSSDRNGIAKNK